MCARHGNTGGQLDGTTFFFTFGFRFKTRWARLKHRHTFKFEESDKFGEKPARANKFSDQNEVRTWKPRYRVCLGFAVVSNNIVAHVSLFGISFCVLRACNVT